MVMVRILALLVAIVVFNKVIGQDLTPLSEIFRLHEGYLVDKWENYLRVYEEELSSLRTETINLLEIGISFGGSLQVWKKYFGPQSIVHGIDIEEKVCDRPPMEMGIVLHCFDATNPEKLRIFFEETAVFDVIIDDGSHYSADIIKTFDVAFVFLKEGGTYIVEDIVCSYLKSYGGAVGKSDSSIEYFKSLVDTVNHLNAFNIDEMDEKIQYYGKWIDHIKFEDGMIVIKKRSTPRIKRNRRINAGSLYPASLIERYTLCHDWADRFGWFENARHLNWPEEQREESFRLTCMNPDKLALHFEKDDKALFGGVLEGHLQDMKDSVRAQIASGVLVLGAGSNLCLPIHFSSFPLARSFCFEIADFNLVEVRKAHYRSCVAFCLQYQIGDLDPNCDRTLYQTTVNVFRNILDDSGHHHTEL
jgi:hypothetical protein